ncbi:MAG TPA: gamma carbonic anhydrase family protein [Gammaproteobacteria bacterium]|nr:gamma carbonic anhydrase family protein [Gammaproteobacteria bacterium]
MTVRPFEDMTPRIAESAFVDETALIIGDVSLGEEASVWPMAVVRGDIHRIGIGPRTNIQDGSVLHVTHAGEFNPHGYPLSVGSEVTVGHRVILHGCTIEDRCLIGMGAVVMDGALIRSGVLLGAGSLVTPGMELEGGYLWLGSPARRVRPLRADEQAFLAYSAEHYVRLKNRHGS